jgi:Domain of Unknown Function with PDB structure (DUF3857)
LNLPGSLPRSLRIVVTFLFVGLLTGFFVRYSSARVTKQTAKQEAKQTAPSKPVETDKNAAQIELLETKHRFETNGDSRKEVHARVKINNELGVQQFARLNFDFNRSFQAVEIPLVRITHTSGGVADILPSAITDSPNPAVLNYPAYHDVRVKSVRILGLQPGDLLEYRVITTTTHHPLAPDFWLDHSFDRAGIVSRERFEIDLPASRKVQLHTASQYKYTVDEVKDSSGARVIYTWHTGSTDGAQAAESLHGAEAKPTDLSAISASSESDVVLTTYAGWADLLVPLTGVLRLQPSPDAAIEARAKELTIGSNTQVDRLAALYSFVAQKIRSVDLPLGSTGFHVRSPAEILASGYAVPEEKCELLSALGSSIQVPSTAALASAASSSYRDLSLPSLFTYILVVSRLEKGSVWLDPSSEVAPFGAVSSALRGKPALLLAPTSDIQFFENIPLDLPFASVQKVVVDAAIDTAGGLAVKVKYALRGDNELLLRAAFHKTSKAKWKDLAQLLALSDGYRGQVRSASASDPYATREPFKTEYEISEPKFVDWSKSPVRIPALLPLPGLPAIQSAGNSDEKALDLGTPLEIELEATVCLPEGTTATAPTGTSVERDYGTFSSKYSAQGNTLHVFRKLHFISREVPTARAGDLNAFLHAVQSDQAQLFTLYRAPQKAEPVPSRGRQKHRNSRWM